MSQCAFELKDRIGGEEQQDRRYSEHQKNEDCLIRILAFEASSDACSVAWRDGATVEERFEVAPRRHGELILRQLSELRDSLAHGARPDYIAVGVGPGAFTGVRIAVAVAQTLAFAWKLRLIPVSSLAAVPDPNTLQSGKVLVANDARRGETYAALFSWQDGELVQRWQRLLARAALIEQSGWPGARACGSLFATYPEVAAAMASRLSGIDADIYPRAAHVAALAKATQALPPLAVRPAYVRNEVADSPASISLKDSG